MYKNLRILVLLVLVGFITGCASKMPLNEGVKEIDTSKKSIMVGRISIQNKNQPGHQPKLMTVSIEKDGKNLSFNKPTLISEVDNEGKEYIFSMASEPGIAELTTMFFFRQAFIVNGSAYLPFRQEIVFPENEIVYIGNIKASIVPRKEGQPRAGSLIPLIDQAVVGFSNGTFVVEVSDNYDEDIALIIEKFPYLADKKITKMILPEWTYPVNKSDSEVGE